MSKYFDYVERFSSTSTRPALMTGLIHGITALVVVSTCAILYVNGWLMESALLIAVAVVVGWFGRAYFRRVSSDKDTPPRDSLQEEPMNKPEPYDERYHVKHLLKRAARVVAVAFADLLLMVLVVLGYTGGVIDSGSSLSLVIAAVVLLLQVFVLLWSAYVFYQQWWKWNNWRIIGDPATGQIGFTQPDSPRWLFVIGSSTDYFNLDEYVLYTPEKSLAEFLLFKRSQMVGLLQGNVAHENLKRSDFKNKNGPPYHEDVKDVDRLLAIQRYWRTLAPQGEAHSRSTIELLEESVDQGEVLIEQNNQIIRLLCILAGANESDYTVGLASTQGENDDTTPPETTLDDTAEIK